jgi:cytochrome c peroxidase
MKKISNILIFASVPALLLSLFIISYSCKKETPISEPAYQPTPYTFQIPTYFPTKLNIPSFNPMTVEGVELGRTLFYDGRFGGRNNTDSLISCSTCHQQSHAFESGNHPAGITGVPTAHVMLPLFNLVWNSNGYTWGGAVYPGNPNASLRTLEDIVPIVIELQSEMNSDTNRSRNLIASIAGYRPLFKKAFGTEDVTFKRMSYAIAQFIRSIVSSNSKFDMYLRGEAQLDASERSGYVLFTTEIADCFHCHGGEGNPLFTTNLFYNNAKDTVFTDLSDHYSITGNPMDIGAFRAPTLRNIELRPPYMHDGRYATLEAVINFYSDSLKWSPSASPLMTKLPYGGAHLIPQQKADLKAFLLTLTDWSLTTNPAYGPPASLPQ